MLSLPSQLRLMFRNQSDDDTLQPSWDLTLELHTEEGGLSDEDAAAAVVAGKRKKKMLSSEQARALERSFEMGSKLEPERKIELARALGLPPRQVAIWFQNRRARWKTKRLEKDYGELKRTLDAMKAQNEALQAQNKKLFCEVLALQGREASEPINLNKETEGSCSMRSDNSSSDAKLGTSRAPQPVHGSPSTPHQGILFFPSYCPPGACQIGMSSSRPGTATPSKVESSSQEDKCFCTNMFSRTDDQSAFWAWQEQHSFHH